MATSPTSDPVALGIHPNVYQAAVEIVSTVRDNINHYRHNAYGSDEIRDMMLSDAVTLRIKMLDFIRAIAWAVYQIQNEDVLKVFQQISAFNDMYSNIQSIVRTKKKRQGFDLVREGLDPEVLKKAEIIVNFLIDNLYYNNSVPNIPANNIQQMIRSEALKLGKSVMDFMHCIAWLVYNSSYGPVREYFETFPNFKNIYNLVTKTAMAHHVLNNQGTAPVPFVLPNPPTSFQYPQVNPQPLGQKVGMVYFPVYGFKFEKI